MMPPDSFLSRCEQLSVIARSLLHAVYEKEKERKESVRNRRKGHTNNLIDLTHIFTFLSVPEVSCVTSLDDLCANGKRHFWFMLTRLCALSKESLVRQPYASSLTLVYVSKWHQEVNSSEFTFPQVG